jgi:hypothetical protein
MDRCEANREILRRLSEYIQENPEIRFCQALYNCHIVESLERYTWDMAWQDEFYTESTETLRRVRGE